MYLYINTTERDLFALALLDKAGVVARKTVPSERQHSEKLLANIAKLLAKHKIKPKDLQGIAAAKGPGSFTSLRIGIATANALAYGLCIPVWGVEKDAELAKIPDTFQKTRRNVVCPEYGSEPKITPPKKK